MLKENGSVKETRYYLGNYEEKIQPDGNIQKIHYLSGGAIYILSSPPTGEPEGALYYAYSDYLGSLVALTNTAGNVVERYAYDPWGVRRNPADWTQTDTRTSWIINRGYTGHEHLSPFGGVGGGCLINMNGRVYDPLTAQFFSPDPVLTDAGNWLDYNRFGYCLNNPLRYTDPSGYTWWAENGAKVLSGAASIIVGGVVSIATGGTGVPAMIASGMASGAAGGFTGGAVYVGASGGSFGEAMAAGLQGAAMGGITSAASIAFPAGVGAAFGHTVGGFGHELLRAGAHGTLNGVLNMAQGGSFGVGFATGALSSLVGSGMQGVGWNGAYLPFITGAVGAGTAWAFGESPLNGFLQGYGIGALNHIRYDPGDLLYDNNGKISYVEIEPGFVSKLEALIDAVITPWSKYGGIKPGWAYDGPLRNVYPEFALISIWRGITTALVNNVVVKTLPQYTKSNLQLGQQMHKAYKAGLNDGINTIKEFRLPSGKRIDFLDIPNGRIYELKPFNPRAMQLGQKQLNIYMQELQSIPRFQGIQWKTILDVY